MSDQIGISLITPVYNSAEYVQPYMECILNQTFRDFEVILVEDCSPDGTYERVVEYLDEHADTKESCGASEETDGVLLYTLDSIKIRLFRNEKNLGAARSRNRGLKEAAGRYICFMDSDDVMSPDALELLCKAAEENDADMAVGYMGYFMPDDTAGHHIRVMHYIGKTRVYLTDYPVSDTASDIEFLFENTLNTPCSKLYRRSMLSDGNLDFTYYPYSEDMPFAYRCMLNSRRTAYVDRELYFYRQGRSGSQSSRQQTGMPLIADILSEIFACLDRKFHGRNTESDAAHRAFAEFALHRMYQSLCDCNPQYINELYDRCRIVLADILPDAAGENQNFCSEFYTDLAGRLISQDFEQPFSELLADYRVKHSINPVFTKVLASRGRLGDFVYDDTKFTIRQEVIILKTMVRMTARRR